MHESLSFNDRAGLFYLQNALRFARILPLFRGTSSDSAVCYFRAVLLERKAQPVLCLDSLGTGTPNNSRLAEHNDD